MRGSISSRWSCSWACDEHLRTRRRRCAAELRAGAAERSAIARPWLLLVPHLIGVAVIFLPLTSNLSAADVLWAYVRTGMRRSFINEMWEGMLAAPFFLAIPLA